MSVGHAEIKKVETIVADMLRWMRVSLSPNVSADTDGIKVDLAGNDSAIMIGFHGETLADFTYLVGIIVKNELGENIQVRIDTGGYLAGRDRRTKDLARKAIEKVKTSGFPETITGLNSYERRLVHAEANKEGLVSESTGTGRDRKIVIKPI